MNNFAICEILFMINSSMEPVLEEFNAFFLSFLGKLCESNIFMNTNEVS